MDPDEGGDIHHLPLLSLSHLRSRMDHLHQFLTRSLNSNTLLHQPQMDLISDEITAAINEVIVTGTSLITPTKPTKHISLQPTKPFDLGCPKTEDEVVEIGSDYDIVEMDAVELLAEHLHFCEVCGKGFKRDANLRMHMRAHGNQFKTLEALSKPVEKAVNEGGYGGKRTRFSCPFTGCSRNKLHKKFRPLKSVICVKNHFKRSHCPKMYSCNRCNKKSFSVLADLKSHLKHCGETKWKCSCGTSFSRKDKLFGHMALFEGHMPQQPEVVVMASTSRVVAVDDDDNDDEELVDKNDGGKIDDMFFDGLGSIDDDDFCLQDLLRGSSNDGFDWNM